MARKKPKTIPPKIDWLWAAVLERKMVFGYDLKDMANIAGVSYEKMRRFINMSPWTWPDNVRETVLQEFGIRVIREVEGQPEGRAVS